MADEDRERPDECECGAWNAGDDAIVDLPCLACYMAGFETPNPDAVPDDGDADES